MSHRTTKSFCHRHAESFWQKEPSSFSARQRMLQMMEKIKQN